MLRQDRFEQARRRARWQTVAMLTAALAGALAYPLLVRAAAPAKGAIAPDFVLKGIDGRNLRLSEYRGDTVVLSFWASWCGPCRESLLRLNALAGGPGSGGPVVLGVNLGDDMDRAVALAGSMHLAFPTLVDSKQAVGRLYDVEKLPLTLLVDADGRVRGAWAGDRDPMPELTRQIKELQSR